MLKGIGIIRFLIAIIQISKTMSRYFVKIILKAYPVVVNC